MRAHPYSRSIWCVAKLRIEADLRDRILISLWALFYHYVENIELNTAESIRKKIVVYPELLSPTPKIKVCISLK